MARKPFGGMKVSFAGAKDTLEEVFGRSDLSPSEMTKQLWAHIKTKKLMSK